MSPLPLIDLQVAVNEKAYTDKVDGKVVFSSSTVGFFSGKRYPKMTSAEIDEAGFEYLKRAYGGFNLPDGRVLRSRSIGGGGTCVDQFSAYLEVTNKNGDILKEYRILYLPDEPELIDHSHCDSGDVYHQKAVPLYLRFIPLEDGTFLGFDRNIVLRFRPDLTTDSPLLNKKVFILERDFDVYKHLGRDPETRTAPLTQELYYKYLTSLQETKH
jgi:hypothetical protein